MNAELDTVAQVIRQRRSIRRYLSKSVPEHVVMHLVEQAGWAPSAHNRQPWRFKVLRHAHEKEHLALAMGQRLRADRMRDQDAVSAIDMDVARSYQRITGAPVVIVVFLTLEDMDVYCDDQRNHCEYLMAVQSTAMAVQNLLLSAHAMGLGACWMCAPLFCMDTVALALKTPSHWFAQSMITVGYPQTKPMDKSRKSLSEIYCET